MKKTFLLLLLGFSIASYSQIPYEYLKAFYPFTDSAQDESGNLNNGVLSGTEAVKNRFELDSSALRFNGINAFVALPTDFDFPARTVSLWFNAFEITDYQKLYCSDHADLQYGSTNIDVHRDISGNNILRLECGGGYGKDIVDTIESNTWYHALITIDTTEVRAYLNGELIDTAQYSDHHSVDGDSIAYLGSNRAINGNFFYGIIDDVRIYDSILNERDILFLHYESPCITEYSIYDTVKVHNIVNDTLTMYDTISVSIADTLTTYDTVFVSVTDTLIIDVTMTGTPDIGTNRITVYPNPAKDRVFIDNGSYEFMTEYSIKIVDIQSRIVFESKINSQLFEINADDFGQPGLYLIHVLNSSNEIITTRKLLLE